MHNKPAAGMFHRYAKGRTRMDSVAGAFERFEDSVPVPPNLAQVIEAEYRVFCTLAHDQLYRAYIHSNGSYTRPWHK